MVLPGLNYIKLTRHGLGLGIILKTEDIIMVEDQRVNRVVKAKIDKKIQTFLVEESIDFIFSYMQMNADKNNDCDPRTSERLFKAFNQINS